MQPGGGGGLGIPIRFKMKLSFGICRANWVVLFLSTFVFVMLLVFSFSVVSWKSTWKTV